MTPANMETVSIKKRGHAELVAEALDGVALQAAFASRFYARGEYAAGHAAYARIRTLCNVHISPAIKAMEEVAGAETPPTRSAAA